MFYATKNCKKTNLYKYCKIGKNKKKYREVTLVNINKKMLIFVSFVAAVTTGVMIFYAKTDEEIKDNKEATVREENIEYVLPTETPVSYAVCLEGDTVTLYLVDDGKRTKIDSVEIDRNYYPSEDIKALSEGITAYNIEEGFKILENFAN